MTDENTPVPENIQLATDVQELAAPAEPVEPVAPQQIKQVPVAPQLPFTGVTDTENGRQYFSEGRLMATIHKDLLDAVNHANLPPFMRGPWGINRSTKP